MKNIAKTKIIATIGPSSWDRNTLEKMFQNGMQIARINASFADKEEIERVTKTIRNISPRIAILLDTQGTKIRVQNLEREIEIKHTVTITSNNQYIPNTIQISYPNLHLDITRGTQILLDDGNIELEVSDIRESSIICNVIQEGILKPNKTVNIPSLNLKFPILTEKDTQDISYAIENKVDFIAASFVRNANDINTIRKIIGDSKIKIIAKIENREGVENFDEILKASDAIMIARGDLSIETELEQIPILQKKMIYKCRSLGKPVIVATQMLESMRENIRPTRAEVSDIANAVMDGTDALMLSAETSTGKHPVETVSMMNKIALSSENILKLSPIYGKTNSGHDIDEISRNTCLLTETIPLKGIIVISDNDNTIISISRHRPNVNIWSISSSISRIRHDSIVRGVKTLLIQDLPSDRDESIKKAINTVYTFGELDLTDKIAIISGSSIKNKDSDAILEIITLKDIINL